MSENCAEEGATVTTEIPELEVEVDVVVDEPGTLEEPAEEDEDDPDDDDPVDDDDADEDAGVEDVTDEVEEDEMDEVLVDEEPTAATCEASED